MHNIFVYIFIYLSSNYSFSDTHLGNRLIEKISFLILEKAFISLHIPLYYILLKECMYVSTNINLRYVMLRFKTLLFCCNNLSIIAIISDLFGLNDFIDKFLY